MRALLRVSNLIDSFTDLIGRLNIFVVTAMVAIGFLNVVARYLSFYVGARLTSNAVIEIQWYLFSILFFLGFAYILRHNLNVRVDFLYARMSLKQRAWIDLIGTVFFIIPFCLLGIYVTYNPVMLSWGRLPDGTFGTWEVSPDPDGLPRAPIKSVIIVAFVLLLLQAVSQVIKYLAILTNTLDEQRAAQIEEYHETAVE
jgi:TRAP-type mannitol/chloroaromatic compound transport system permease small subunit